MALLIQARQNRLRALDLIAERERNIFLDRARRPGGQAAFVSRRAA